MLGEAFHAAEALRAHENPEPLEKAARIVEPASQRQGDHPPEAVHLPARQRVLRMVRQSRVVHARDLRMADEPLRDRQRVFAVTRHPQRQRLEPAQREEAVERSQYRAHGVVQKGELLFELGIVAGDDRAADHVGVPVQVFIVGVGGGGGGVGDVL